MSLLKNVYENLKESRLMRVLFIASLCLIITILFALNTQLKENSDSRALRSEDNSINNPAVATIEDYRTKILIQNLEIGKTIRYASDGSGCSETLYLAGSVKNSGEQTATQLSLRAYYLDSQNREIAEFDIPVNLHTPLRPNYVQDFSQPLKNIPDAWRTENRFPERRSGYCSEEPESVRSMRIDVLSVTAIP